MAIDSSEVNDPVWLNTTTFYPHVREGVQLSAKQARVEQPPSVCKLCTLEENNLQLTADVKHRIKDTNAVNRADRTPDDEIDSSNSVFNESDDDNVIGRSLSFLKLGGNLAKDGIKLFTCRGVSPSNNESYKMSVDEYGEINCSSVQSSYLPTQFEILTDEENVSIPGHVVCIRSRGFGPKEKFYVALTDSGKKMRFTVQNAGSGMKNRSIPIDKKFYFTVSYHSGGYRFQAVTGDRRYLAFKLTRGRGVQVTVTDKNAKSKLFNNTVFDLIKW